MRRATLAFIIGAILSTAVNLSGQSVFPSAIPKVTSLPSTCSPTGQTNVVFKTTATVGMYQCLVVNTWTAVADSGGSPTFAALTVTGNVNLTGLTFDPTKYANTMSLIFPNGNGLYVADAAEDNWMELASSYFALVIGTGNASIDSATTIDLSGATGLDLTGGAAFAAARLRTTLTPDGKWDSKGIVASATANHLIWDYSTTAGTVAVTGTETTAITFDKSLAASDFILNNGNAFKTDATTGHTGLCQAYDVDNTTYRTFCTATNGNTPTWAWAAPAGGSLTGNFTTLQVGGTNVVVAGGALGTAAFTALTGGTITGAHVSNGSAPSVANVGANSCGTTAATVAGNDNNGIITVGATAGTQCRVAFTVAATTRRECTVTDSTTTVATRATYVDTTHTDFLGAFVAGDVVTYVCIAR